MLQLQLGLIVGISLILVAVCVIIELHRRKDDDIDENFFYLEKLYGGGEINEKQENA